MFEDLHFSGSQDAASSALVATQAVCSKVFDFADAGVEPEKQLTVRAALHWGQAYIPSSGRLRDQILGSDVVIGTRLCDWLHVIEEARPVRERGIAVAATKAFYDLLPKTEKRNWTKWGDKDFKGLSEKVCIYQRTSKR